MQNGVFQHGTECLMLHEFTQWLFWAEREALRQSISYENDSSGVVCGSAYKSSKSAQRIQNPTITQTALQRALSAPETVDGERCSPKFSELFGDCTVLFENKTTLFIVYRKKSELFSTPQLIIKCTHTKLLAGPLFDEGLSLRWFGPPT